MPQAKSAIDIDPTTHLHVLENESAEWNTTCSAPLKVNFKYRHLAAGQGSYNRFSRVAKSDSPVRWLPILTSENRGPAKLPCFWLHSRHCQLISVTKGAQKKRLYRASQGCQYFWKAIIKEKIIFHNDCGHFLDHSTLEINKNNNFCIILCLIKVAKNISKLIFKWWVLKKYLFTFQQCYIFLQKSFAFECAKVNILKTAPPYFNTMF